MAIQSRNIKEDSFVNEQHFTFHLGPSRSGAHATATQTVAAENLYVAMPRVNGTIKEIAMLTSETSASGSVTVNFYRAGSASIASATTTSLLASGGITIITSTAVGSPQTATLNTSIITGRNGGMIVSGGTTLLIALTSATGSGTYSGLTGYFSWQEDMG